MNHFEPILDHRLRHQPLFGLLLLLALLPYTTAEAQCTPEKPLSGETFPAGSSHRCLDLASLAIADATVESGAALQLYAPQIRVTPTTTFAGDSNVLLQGVILEVEHLSQQVDDDLTLTLNGSGSERYTIADPAHGSLSGAPPNLTYTPDPGYSGSDHFRYAVDDGANPPRFHTVYISIEEPQPVLKTRPLNDTGQTWGGDYPNGNNTTCTSNITAPQDCHQGRDALAAAGQLQKTGAGSAGFDFTKLDANGSPLAKDATSWSCVKDHVTGLIWEVKAGPGNDTVGDEGLHDADDRFTWYDTNPATNGGADGVERDSDLPNTCYGYQDGNPASYCNTQAFAARVNAQGHCGHNDWRLPTYEELGSIVDYGRDNPAIDTDYFPGSQSTWFWSSSAYASSSNGAWAVNFGYGDGGYSARYYGYALRLVRGGQ